MTYRAMLDEPDSIMLRGAREAAGMMGVILSDEQIRAVWNAMLSIGSRKLHKCGVIETMTMAGDLRSLADIEAEAIANALIFMPTRSEAARALQIGRSSLYRKIAEANHAKALGT